jgi:hypothetical protein
MKLDLILVMMLHLLVTLDLDCLELRKRRLVTLFFLKQDLSVDSLVIVAKGLL